MCTISESDSMHALWMSALGVAMTEDLLAASLVMVSPLAIVGTS